MACRAWWLGRNLDLRSFEHACDEAHEDLDRLRWAQLRRSAPCRRARVSVNDGLIKKVMAISRLDLAPNPRTPGLHRGNKKII